jgi:hypothetical protein
MKNPLEQKMDKKRQKHYQQNMQNT